MNEADREQLKLLREEVNRDIALALANFKIWLLVTVLSNVVLIGIPALYVFFSTSNTSQAALTMSMDNRKRLDEQARFAIALDARITAIERHLGDRDHFVPLPPVAAPQ